MEIKDKLGNKVPCGDMFKEIMGGDTMEFYAITLTYVSDDGITQEQKFRKSTIEETED